MQYKLEHSTGISFVKTTETASIVVKLIGNRTVIESNPFPLNHRPDDAVITQITEQQFNKEYVKAIYAIGIEVFGFNIPPFVLEKYEEA